MIIEKLNMAIILVLAMFGWASLLSMAILKPSTCPKVEGERLYAIHETSMGLECVYSPEVSYGTKNKKRRAA